MGPYDRGALPVVERQGHRRAAQRQALRWALGLNGLMLVVEIAGGIAFGSIALLADGVHLVTDVAGLVVALLALRLMARPATSRHSYGLQRAEVLAAQVNGLLLVGASAWIAYEAIRRLVHGGHVDGGPVIIVAMFGIAVNVASAMLLQREAGRSLNIRGAFLHMASDAFASFGVVIAGIAALVWGNDRVDPIISLCITAVILWAAWGLLRDSTHVLLEGTPRHLDPRAVSDAIADDPAVSSVHHLHLWDLASDAPALSAHVVLGGEVSLHDAQHDGARLKHMLAGRFGITHATLELECHDCEPPDAGAFPIVIGATEPRGADDPQS